MKYPVEKIRNICLMGHGGDGKTSLLEAMLFFTGAIDRLGKTYDGNTACDADSALPHQDGHPFTRSSQGTAYQDSAE